jgi:ketosteroid isomerase-like protein
MEGSMRQREAFLAAVGLALGILLASPGVAQEPRASIEAGNRQWEAAVAKGDGAAVAALYTANGQLLPAGSEAVTGTAAIQKFWQGVMDSGIRGAKLTTLEVEGHGDSAHEVGQYELRDQGGKVLDKGKYVVIWKRDGGRFKLHRDIWTTSQPPAKP